MNDLAISGSKISVVLSAADDITRVTLAVYEAQRGGSAGQKSVADEARSILAGAASKRALLESSLAQASEKHVATFLAQLLKAYPNVGKDDASAFGRLLLEDVIDEKPSMGAMEAGCRAVRQSSKFLPSIAEVLTAIRAAEASIKGAVSRLDRLPELVADLEQHMAESERVAALRTARARIVG